MTDKTQPTAHAEIAAPISADLRRIDGGDAYAPDPAPNVTYADHSYPAYNKQALRDFADATSALRIAALQAAPPAPAGVAVPADAPDLLPPTGIRNDRDMLNYLMGAFDSEVHYCARCGHDEATKDMDSASLLRDYLAAAPAQAVAVPVELQGVKETVEQGGGFWRSCTGCHELNEGHSTGPFSAVFGCALGNGCSECGGIGAVWDDADYGAMAAAPAQEHATQLAGGAVAYLDLGAGGYLDIGTDLSDAQLAKLPKGRHILVISGTHGVDGYAAAPAQAQEDARDLEAEALRACSDLPEGWDIVIHLEKGSGSVVLIDPEFNESDVALDGSLFDALKESIDQAVQAGAARAAQGGAA